MNIDIREEIAGLYTASCDLDLGVLRKTSDEMYDLIKDNFTSDKSDYNGQSTLTTKLFSQYNFCLYPLPGINELYWTIHHVFHNCLTHYHQGRVNERYFMQSWLNYYQKGEFIDWHCHTQGDVGGWHGFFCLDVEPDSFTSYKWPNDPERKDLIIDVPSKNNKLVIGTSNSDLHRSSDWSHDRPRITIAFDILPLEHIYEGLTQPYDEPKYLNAMRDVPFFVNHFIPM